MDGRREGLEDTILSLVESIDDTRINGIGNDSADGFFYDEDRQELNELTTVTEKTRAESSLCLDGSLNGCEKNNGNKNIDISDVERPPWDEFYRNRYNEGLVAYGENRLEDAYMLFEKALDIIRSAKTHAVEWRQTLPVKENACIYMMLYVLNAQKSEPERVMRNLHSLKNAIFEFFEQNLLVDPELLHTEEWEELKKGEVDGHIKLKQLAGFLDRYHRYVIDQIVVEFKSQVPVNSVLFSSIMELEQLNGQASLDYAEQRRLVEEIHIAYFDSVRESDAFLSDYQREFYKKIENLWKAHFFLNRFASMSFQFHSRSFLVKESFEILTNSENSSDGALIGMMLLPQEIVDEDDKQTKILPWMVSQTEHWLKENPDIDKLEAVLLITGDRDTKLMSVSASLYYNSISTITSYQSGNEEGIHNADFEHSIKMVVMYNFSNGVDDPANLEKYYDEIEKCFQLSLKYPFCKKVALLAKTLQARLLTEFIICKAENERIQKDMSRLFERVNQAYAQAKGLIEEDNENIDIVAQTYLNLVEPTVELLQLEMMSIKEMYIENSLISNDNVSNEFMHRVNGDKKFILSGVAKIFNHFNESFDENDQIVREVTGLQRFEAEKFYILAMALLHEINFRVDMLTNEGKSKKEIMMKDKDILISLIARAEALLCESYRILVAIGFADESLKINIYYLYLNLMKFHLELTGVPENNINRVMENTDMDDVLESFLRQEWTNALREICEKSKKKTNDNYKNSVILTYKEALKHLAPFITQVTIVEKDEKKILFSMFPLDQGKVELFKDVLEKKSDSDDEIYEKYCYSNDPERKNGTYITCIKLNSRQELFIESAYRFTDNIMDEIIEVTKGLKSLLAIYSSRFDTSGKKLTQKELDEHLATIVEQINHRHLPTVRHSLRMARFIEAFFAYWNDKIPEIPIDVEHLKIKARKHDVGKMYLHSRILLQKDGRLSDSEIEEVQNHPKYGYIFCSSVLETNDEVVAHAHHQGYGVDCKKYPFEDLIGDKIKTLPERFSSFTSWRGISRELTETQAIEVRSLCSLDIAEALTSTDRIYRSPMNLEAIVGYFCDRAGKEIDPRFAYLFIDAINLGYYDHLIFRKAFVESLRAFLRDKLFAFPEYIIDRVVAFISTNYAEVIKLCDDDDLTDAEIEELGRIGVFPYFSKSGVERQYTDKEKLKYIKYLIHGFDFSSEVNKRQFKYPEIYRLDDILEFLRTYAHEYGLETINSNINGTDKMISEFEDELGRLNEWIIETGDSIIDLWITGYSLNSEIMDDIQKLKSAETDKIDMRTRFSIYNKMVVSLIQNNMLENSAEFLEYFDYYKSRTDYLGGELKKYKEKKLRAEQYKNRISRIISVLIGKFEEGESQGLLMSTDALDSSIRGELFELAKSTHPHLKPLEDINADYYNEIIREDVREFFNPLNHFKQGFVMWAKERGLHPMSPEEIMRNPLGFKK